MCQLQDLLQTFLTITMTLECYNEFCHSGDGYGGWSSSAQNTTGKEGADL